MSEGRVIHIVENSGGGEEFERFEVWLDDDTGRRANGFCLGMGETRKEALNQAIQDLQETILELQNMGRP